MLDKIPLEQIYMANYVKDSVEYIYNNRIHSVSVIHHYRLKKNKHAFLYLKDENNQFVGYLNVFNKKICQEQLILLDDYEMMFKDYDLENIKIFSKTNSGYINFEPLKNYNSKYMKPIMNLKQLNKVLKDINKQKEEKPKIKKLLRIS